MKSLNQLLFTQADQVTLLEQWQNCDEYGLTTRQFCEALIANGSDAAKEIGQAGLDAPAKGQHFTDILMDWYPHYIVNAITTSEQVGNRQAGLIAAIKQLQGGQNIVLNIMKSLWFPFILLFVTGGIGLYVSDEILKSVTVKGGMGQTMNDIVATYGIPIAFCAIGLLILIAFTLPTLTGQLRQWLDSWPIFSLYRTATAASLMSTLSNLLACGLKLDAALHAIEHHASPYLRSHIIKMREQRIGQMNLGNVLDTGLILPFELGTLKILGGHADFSSLLIKTANAHQIYVDKRLARMSAILPKIGLLLVIALLAGLVGTAINQLLTSVNY